MNRLLALVRRLPEAVGERLRVSAYDDPGSAVPVGPDPFRAIEADVRKLIADVAQTRKAGAEALRESVDTTRGLLLSLLEVIDALDRVAVHGEKKAADLGSEALEVLSGNVSSVGRLLRRSLAEVGVEAIPVRGEFDPHLHTVADLVSDPEGSPGAIVGEIRPGYRWGDEILRKSELLVVGEPPPEATTL